MDAPTTLEQHACFGGTQSFFEHASEAIGLPMRFGLYLPPQAQQGPVPVLVYLAGLTCNEQTFAIKAGAQQFAAQWFLIGCGGAVEDQAGAPGAVLLGYDVWVQHFSADSSIVGRTIQVNAKPHTVVGVMPRRFWLSDMDSPIWIALDLRTRPSEGGGFWLGGIARRYDIKVEPEDTSLERGTGLGDFRIVVSLGEMIDLSSMKSPRCESSSSPIGVSSEIGSFAIFRTLRTLSSGSSMRSAISSGVGSRPSSWTR